MDYVYGTSFMCLDSGKSNKGVLEYVYSDHCKDLNKRISIIGYVCTLNICVISWKAQLQSLVLRQNILRLLNSLRKMFGQRNYTENSMTE